MKLGGIVDLDKAPNTTDPEHTDVKLTLTMYSFEWFLFSRVNESSRKQISDVIDTLGPYAWTLTQVIGNI